MNAGLFADLQFTSQSDLVCGNATFIDVVVACNAPQQGVIVDDECGDDSSADDGTAGRAARVGDVDRVLFRSLSNRVLDARQVDQYRGQRVTIAGISQRIAIKSQLSTPADRGIHRSDKVRVVGRVGVDIIQSQIDRRRLAKLQRAIQRNGVLCRRPFVDRGITGDAPGCRVVIIDQCVDHVGPDGNRSSGWRHWVANRNRVVFVPFDKRVVNRRQFDDDWRHHHSITGVSQCGTVKCQIGSPRNCCVDGRDKVSIVGWICGDVTNREIDGR